MENIVEEKKIEDVAVIPIVVNTVDDPNNLSVSSISPLPEKADEVVKTEEEERETPVIPKTEKKEEKKETSEEPLPEKKVEVKPKEKDPVQRRIDEITKKRREAERESAFKDTKISKLEEELKVAKSAIPPIDEPQLENFETESDYLKALTKWEVQQTWKEEREKASKEVATVEEKKAVDETYQELDEIMAKTHKKYPDFDIHLFDSSQDEDPKFSDTMVEAIFFLDAAEDVLYYLGNHPEKAQEIATLTPPDPNKITVAQKMKVAHELGKIEARLNAPPPRKKTTNAPEPITPVKTTGVTEQDPSNMNPKEFRAWRERNKG